MAYPTEVFKAMVFVTYRDDDTIQVSVAHKDPHDKWVQLSRVTLSESATDSTQMAEQAGGLALRTVRHHATDGNENGWVDK